MLVFAWKVPCLLQLMVPCPRCLSLMIRAPSRKCGRVCERWPRSVWGVGVTRATSQLHRGFPQLQRVSPKSPHHCAPPSTTKSLAGAKAAWPTPSGPVRGDQTSRLCWPLEQQHCPGCPAASNCRQGDCPMVKHFTCLFASLSCAGHVCMTSMRAINNAAYVLLRFPLTGLLCPSGLPAEMPKKNGGPGQCVFVCV